MCEAKLKLINKIISNPDIGYNFTDNSELEVYQVLSEAKTHFDDSYITAEEKTIIPFKSSDFGVSKLFNNFEDFIAKADIKDKQVDFVILDFNNQVLLKKHETDYFTNISSEKILQTEIISNYFTFLKLISILTLKSDHHDEISKQLVFYSNARGIFKLSYTVSGELFNANELISIEIIDKIETQVQNEDFKNSLINEFIEKLESYSSNEKVIKLFKSIEPIYDGANRNYEIKAKRFSFRNLKNGFQREKEKYFYSIREILGKILTQLFTIPVAVSAVIFTISDKGVPNIQVSISIGIIFFFYCLLLFFIVRFYYLSVLDLIIELKLAKVKVEETSPSQEITNEINHDFIKIRSRINSLRNLIIVLQITIVLSFVIVGFLVMQSIFDFLIRDTFGNIV